MALAANALLAQRAAAHAPPQGIQIIWPDNGASTMPFVLTNRGLVLPNVNNQDGPGGDYSLRCNDSYHLATSEMPILYFADMGLLGMQSANGVSLTGDRGCSWMDTQGLPDISIGGFFQNQSAPNQMLATTRIYTMPAQVFSSHDYGRTWTLLYTNNMYTIYEKLLASPDGQTIFAAGHYYDSSLSTIVPLWATSGDGGKTWTDTKLDEATKRIPLGLHPTDAKVVFAYIPDPDDTALDPMFKLLRSDDGGATFTQVLVTSQITAYAAAPDGSAIWIGTQLDGLFKSTDGGHTFTRQNQAEVQGISCLAYHQNQLWMCANVAPNDNGIFYSTDGGDSYKTLLDFNYQVTTQVQCSAAEMQVCGQPWIDWQYEQSTGFTADAGAPLPDGGIGGAVYDAGSFDVSEDSGVPSPTSDGGLPIGDHSHEGQNDDAGVIKDTPSKSSGCSAHGASANTGWWLLSLAALLARRRRRH